ncbi:MAG: hypothetical protein WCI20_15850 [bacterium]|jgi:hypothetical protein
MSNEDIKHVELLSLFHYIVGGITAFFSCIPFIHVAIGLAMLSGKMFREGHGAPPPAFIGWLFIIMGSVFIVLGWSMAICIIIAGRQLKRHRNRMFCMVVAGLECMFMPFGTILGVFTLIALNKDTIKEMFTPPTPPPPIQTAPLS